MPAGCASTPARELHTEIGHAPLEIEPVKNLAGVPLKIPSIYFGDAVGKGARLKIVNVDLGLLAEAAVLSHLGGLGYRTALKGKLDAPPKYQVHSAVTELDMTQVRQTGRFRMGMVVMLVDAASQLEVARGAAEREFQLLDVAPDEAGVLGTQRFIEKRLQTFTETLAREAVDSAGF